MDVERLRKHWLPLVLASLGLIFFVYGLKSLLGTSKSNEITFSREDSASSGVKSGSETGSLVSVDIEGAVVKPGVYKLPAGSIIQDALVLSQGLSEEADRDFVSKNINLAAKILDGAKIYIPKIGESAATSQASGSDSVSGLININTASADALDTLPGIGPVTADKIINNRPYATINELLDKKVVSSKVFTQIKDKITAY